jgi:quercetin dioxygenase-like cupin family protein
VSRLHGAPVDPTHALALIAPTSARRVLNIIDHDSQPLETWRDGVTTRPLASALTGASQLCTFEQWCEPGAGAPIRLHAVEEVLTVLAGRAEVQVGGETRILGPGHSIVVPAGARHGFTNVGDGPLHMLATLAAPIFEAAYDAASETRRRWSPAGAAE